MVYVFVGATSLVFESVCLGVPWRTVVGFLQLCL